MRSIASILFLLALGAPALAENPAGPSFDWKPWRYLPVQDGGRRKPLDTLAWETFRSISNRAVFTDPQTGRNLDATACYLTLLFEWQGWDQAAGAHGPRRMEAAHFDKPDAWDKTPLVRLESLELQRALGITEGQKFIAPEELGRVTFRDPATGKEQPLLLWAEMLQPKDEQNLTQLQRKAYELAGRLMMYRDLRAGNRLGIAPLKGSPDQQWVTVADLMQASLNDANDPTGQFRKAKDQFRQARAAYLAGSPDAFHEATTAFITTLGDIGPQLGPYPSAEAINLEVAYNHWAPFRFAWVLTTVAALCMLASMAAQWKPLYVTGIGTFALALVAMLVGFALRVAISGRAPVTNMYESVTYLALGTAFLGLIFELLYRKGYILTAAATVATVALVLADNCPAVLDPSLQPLQPVLRSNFWLVIHVMCITLSYAAFALALGIGNVVLGYFLVRSKDREAIAALTRFTYRALQVGVVFLASGTFLGGVWAAYSWGRFWGWDPKEVWALIALLGYIAVLHARYAGWVRDRGLAALSVLCFSLVVMAWYGVNFVLGAGLHTYGFGGGGKEYVFGAIVAQCLYVVVALGLSANQESETDACAALETT